MGPSNTLRFLFKFPSEISRESVAGTRFEKEVIAPSDDSSLTSYEMSRNYYFTFFPNSSTLYSIEPNEKYTGIKTTSTAFAIPTMPDLTV